MTRKHNILPRLLSLCLCGFSSLAAQEAPARPGDIPHPGLLDEVLNGPVAGVDEIVFAVRHRGDPKFEPHWYANIGYFAHDENLPTYFEGGRLAKLNIRTGEVTVLLEDPKGTIRDPQVHYNGERILFAYRKGGTPHFHLYEINIDGTGLTELTTGPWDDFEPTYTASGEILFLSTRAKRWVNCWKTHVAVIYRCDADGRKMRPLSSNNEHDNTPWPLPDGRILYTRWEYTDRSQVHYHGLWTMNPDGSQQMTYYGNQSPGIVMIDAKPIDGTGKVVATFSPGHGRYEHNGDIAVVDPGAGPDAGSAATYITKNRQFRDPWGFSENLFLAARKDDLVLVDGQGRYQTIYSLPKRPGEKDFAIHEPRPVIRREPERLLAPRVDLAQTTGTVILADVNQGRRMEGVRSGEIKKLLILETLPMPIHFDGGATPISYSGTFTLERIVGTVPVEEDGSAHFELPALRSFFFVALDENDLSVKRMQSFMTVQPGEALSCVGCHEQRTEAPRNPARPLMALARPASRIEPIADVPDVFDFPRDIQPILDRRCVSCHNYERRGGDVVLTGDHGPIYSHSYFNIMIRHQVADGENRPESNYAPRAIGSSASPLMQKLEDCHHGVHVTPHEKKMIRLWIESGAAYPGTYAAVGTGQIRASSERLPNTAEFPEWPLAKQAEEVMEQRCASCHEGATELPKAAYRSASFKDLQQPPRIGYPRPIGAQAEATRRFSSHAVYNLTRPEKSMLLLAPLSREDGGYGLCGKDVLSGTGDPAYQAILASINEAQRELGQMKRFDMPGFVPRYAWVREMKRFGILPPDHDPAQPVDYYAVEREYWESLWYRPTRDTAAAH